MGDTTVCKKSIDGSITGTVTLYSMHYTEWI